MIKKVVTLMSGIVLAGAFVLALPVETEAALPCTYDIINDANANIASNTAAYQQAGNSIVVDVLIHIMESKKNNQAVRNRLLDRI